VEAGTESAASKLSVKNKHHPSKRNGKKSPDIFSEILVYWDSVAQLIHCAMHLMMNTGKDITQLLSNAKGKEFGAKQLETEWARGRFLETKDFDIPWHLSEAEQTEFDRRFSTFPCPAGFGSALKCPFTDASRLKGNDFVHLLSSIGIFALGTFLPLDQRRVLQKLCRALHGLSRTALKLSELTVLEMELVETLTEWEIYFPFLSCTINIHLLLHLPSQIARSGPLPFTWMYSLEREAGRLVDAVYSLKCAEESIARNYVVTELVEHRRAARPEASSPIHRHFHAADGDLTMLPLYLRTEPVCSLEGSGVAVQLSTTEQAKLLLLWRHRLSGLNELHLRYEEEVRMGVTEGPIFAWLPSSGEPLTAEQEQMRFAPCFDGVSFVRAYRNHAYFRGVAHDVKRVTSNCCFKAVHPFHGQVFGILHSVLVHRAYPHPDAPVSVFAKAAAWCKPVVNDPETGLGRCKQFHVLPSSDSDMALFSTSFCPFSACLPIPVTLIPQKEDENETVFFVFEIGR